MKKFLNISKRFVSITINGNVTDVPLGASVYEATKMVLSEKERVPTICYHPNIPTEGNCGICMVEEVCEGGNKMIPSCVTPVTEGMEIITDSPVVNENIKSVLKFMLSSHPLECKTCGVSGSCVFQDVVGKYKVSVKTLPEELKEKYEEYSKEAHAERIFGNNAIEIDRSKCLKCNRCVRVCRDIQGMNVLEMINLEDGSKELHIRGTEEDSFANAACISCGQCSVVCPTGAIQLKSAVSAVSDHIKNKGEKTIVCSIAPTVRITIAEALGMKPGELTEGKLAAALKAVGFDYAFDTNFTADLTIIEEGNELIQRVVEGGVFPMFTSCCPGWVNMVEQSYPQFIPNLSSCRSPQGMMGSLVKEYWSEKVGLEAENIVSVSIMPCTAKKDEIQREQLAGEYDYVLTVRELATLFKENKVKAKAIKKMEEQLFDDPLGEATGAAVIFGATGGVMEAALRTAYEVLTGEELPGIDFMPARGLDGIKEATVKVGDLDLNIAVVHSGSKIKELLAMIENGEKDYHFVEVMACPGGCIGGGGNPKVLKNRESNLQERMEAIYRFDTNNTMRKSHENPSVVKLYEEYLIEPLGHKSHHLLHTTYSDRSANKMKI